MGASCAFLRIARADFTSLREFGRIKFSGMTKDNYGAAASVRANVILLVSSSHQVYVLGYTMMQNIDAQGLQSKAEARLASLKEEKLVTRIAVLSTLLGQGKQPNGL